MNLPTSEKQQLLKALQNSSMENRLNALQTIYQQGILDDELLQAVAEIRQVDASLSLQKLAQEILIQAGLEDIPEEDDDSSISFEEENLKELSDHEMLVKLIAIQEEQQITIQQMSYRVGCLYAALLVSVALTVLSFLVEFFLR